MNTCKYCGKPLTLTPEYDACMECQGKIMRESTIPQNSFANNSTKTSMNNYDESKVISHEEARKIALDMLPKQIGSNSSRRKLNKYFEMDVYFKQQEKKDERAKKEHELLGLYQKRFGFYNFDEDKDLREIKLKEKELEEME